MRSVTVAKADLLTILKENKTKHRSIFLEAQRRYRERCIEELDKTLADARAGRNFQLQFRLPVPEDHTKEYNQVIKMVEMSQDDNLELTNQEFATFVMDDWSWKAAWAANTASYTNR